jgi:hypothetical protein
MISKYRIAEITAIVAGAWNCFVMERSEESEMCGGHISAGLLCR